MAWIQTGTSGNYHVCFRYGGKKFKRSLKTKSEREALAKKFRIEETIKLLETGRLELPELVDVPTYLMSDGKLASKPKVKNAPLEKMFELYFDSIPEDGLESNTLKMIEIHQRHLVRLFGKRFNLRQIRLSDLQSYVNKRAAEPGIRGRSVSGSTIKKEIVTLRSIWRWAVLHEYLPEVPLPSKGLKYPKRFELPPFQTFDEVSRQTSALDPSSAEAKDLWATVFLNIEEIQELLDHVRDTGRHTFVYPMFVFAAHTGARRSEILRSEKIDISGGVLTVREKKRVKRTNSTRKVPISKRLQDVLNAWFEVKPESNFTICHSYGSSCQSQPGESLSANEANKLLTAVE